jgi:hypothetical protein
MFLSISGYPNTGDTGRCGACLDGRATAQKSWGQRRRIKVSRKVLFVTSILMICLCSPGWAQSPLDLPEEPLRLIALSATDDCPICARQTREIAFQMFEQRFHAGRMFTTTGSCRLVRTALSEDNELGLLCDSPGKESLPLLTFRFHTAANHLVGISPADFTEENIASKFPSAPPGTVFEGILETILFRYGDGTTYNYSASRGVIQVHCRLISLTRQTP